MTAEEAFEILGHIPEVAVENVVRAEPREVSLALSGCGRYLEMKTTEPEDESWFLTRIEVTHIYHEVVREKGEELKDIDIQNNTV